MADEQFEIFNPLCRLGDLEAPLPPVGDLPELGRHLGAALGGVDGGPARHNVLDIGLTMEVSRGSRGHKGRRRLDGGLPELCRPRQPLSRSFRNLSKR